MQEIMSRHKTTSFSPRDCLKTVLHQRWSKTCSGRVVNRLENLDKSMFRYSTGAKNASKTKECDCWTSATQRTFDSNEKTLVRTAIESTRGTKLRISLEKSNKIELLGRDDRRRTVADGRRNGRRRRTVHNSSRKHAIRLEIDQTRTNISRIHDESSSFPFVFFVFENLILNFTDLECFERNSDATNSPNRLLIVNVSFPLSLSACAFQTSFCEF